MGDVSGVGARGGVRRGGRGREGSSRGSPGRCWVRCAGAGPGQPFQGRAGQGGRSVALLLFSRLAIPGQGRPGQPLRRSPSSLSAPLTNVHRALARLDGLEGAFCHTASLHDASLGLARRRARARHVAPRHVASHHVTTRRKPRPWRPCPCPSRRVTSRHCMAQASALAPVHVHAVRWSGDSPCGGGGGTRSCAAGWPGASPPLRSASRSSARSTPLSVSAASTNSRVRACVCVCVCVCA